MSKPEDITKEVESFKNSLQPYVGYDIMVGGLVSKSIKNLTDVQELLKEVTAKSVQEALAKIQALRDVFAPYGSYAPEMLRTLNSIADKISNLQNSYSS